MIEIKHRGGNRVLYSGKHEDLKSGVEAAVAAGANLAGADLPGANLDGANLDGANLAGANLAGANLAGANLARANLAGADLAGANLPGANLDGANLANVVGRINDSHELLAAIAIRFDQALIPVAAMIAGRLVGCWQDYTKAIREHFGEDVMRRLWQAWAQDESWGVVERMKLYGWPEPVAE